MTRFTQTLIIVAALVVAGAGSATAAKLITGKQIKDHSITKKDLKKGLLTAGGAGAAGPAGKDGKDGKDGAPGPAGKDGVNGTNGTNGTNGKDGKTGPSAILIRRKTAHAIPNSQFRTVITETLPAGTYSVRADLVAIPGNAGSHSCALRSDNVDIATDGFAAGADEAHRVSMVGRAEVTAGSITISCDFAGDDSGSTQDISLESTLAGDVTVFTEAAD